MREMKDSGIEWIGEIPSSWNLTKLKYCLELCGSGTTPKSNNMDYYDGDIPWIQSGDLYDTNIIVDTSVKVTDSALRENSALKVYQKDFLVIAMYGASVGNAAISKISACTNQACCCLTPNKDNCLDFLYYWVLYCKDNFLAKAVGGTQPNISQIMIKNQWFLDIPYYEQLRIISHLNSECKKLNQICNDIQHQIEILQEYKQSVITEAVTKGIRGNRPMKNSGVNWIDKIPADWDFKKITWLLDYNSIYPIGDGDHGLIKADDYLENGIPFIRVQNLGWGTNLQLDNIVYISEELNHRIANSTLHPNDIIFAKTGATIGKTAIIPDSLPISNTTSHVGKITVDTKYYPKFIFHYLSSKIGYKLFWDIAQMKTTRPEVGIEEFKQVRILIPRDIEEQKEISAYIEKKCEEIDNILADKQKQLDTLTEYKNSLIYEYVTGKKEVPADA